MIALSTAWNADRHEDGRSIIEEIDKLGVKSVELNFSLTVKMVEDISKYCKEKGLVVTSLHNYCPIPKGLKRSEALPDCFSLSSADEDERKRAVEFTKITISTAKRLSAHAVVIHAGRVEIEDRTRILIDLYRAEGGSSDRYKSIFNSFVNERQGRQEVYLPQILKSLKTLADYASRLDISLGIENRFYYREIPSFEEAALIFDEVKNASFWLDVGHAYIHDRLGFTKFNRWLKHFAGRLIGIHCHNVKGLIDHQAPFDGEFDFNTLKPYVKPGVLKVTEIHDNVTASGAKRSIDYLEGVFND